MSPLLLGLLCAAPKPAAEVVVTPLRGPAALAAEQPCLADPQPPVGVVEICVGQLKAQVRHEGHQLVSQLTISQRAIGKKLFDGQFLGALALVGDRLYFWKGFELWFVTPADPQAKPMKASPLDCGTEGSPLQASVVDGRGVCSLDTNVTEVEWEKHAPGVLYLSSGIEDDKSPYCKVPAAAWKKTGASYTVQTAKLPPACAKLLRGQ